MSLSVCPAAIVAAPIENVWELLAHPARYDEWWDAHTERIVPEGPATPGQTIHAWSTALGRRWDVTLVMETVDADKHQVQFTTTFPFRVVTHNRVMCTPVDAATCRV